VFAGPRDDPFFVDLGSIFDLGGLRPFNAAHIIPLENEGGEDGVQNYNVFSIAIQVPKTDLLPSPMADGKIGIYATASREATRGLNGDGTVSTSGEWVQVSRLGNPLVNEVVIPIGQKDLWNSSDPAGDSQFASRYTSPELAGLVNFLYPVLPDTPTTNRTDLVAVLLTGVPGLNFTGSTQADLLRLNTAVAPTKKPEPLGVLAGDLQGFPNGRRLADDVTDIEIRAVACGYGSFLAGLLQWSVLSPVARARRRGGVGDGARRARGAACARLDGTARALSGRRCAVRVRRARARTSTACVSADARNRDRALHVLGARGDGGVRP